ncbi:class I SAM-dependent methyltransferase [Saccharomonospora sp. NPDC046836]|uniref:class I SAM-dependent methyltransferase n=1 Tax=Saccharomonospora sp. NPDC046836 TaxID=3156921 RepID=UPI0033E3D527
MPAHTHDHVDWASRLTALRRQDSLERDPLTVVATRLGSGLPQGATVVDVGSGAGGMSAALTHTLRQHGGGTMILVDAVDELLAAAQDSASAVGDGTVNLRTVGADVGSQALQELVPAADLVWASAVVHHLPDQQVAVDRLAAALRPSGMLAVSEGGLDTRCLPWDMGFGKPGLELRLNAIRDSWFEQLRATMPEAVRMPYGWTTALRHAGLVDVGSFTYLVDHPAPADDLVREFAIDRIGWLAEIAEDQLDAADRATARRLLDPDAPEYLGARDDLYLLSARTVHYGRRP